MSEANTSESKKTGRLERDLIKYSAAAGAAVLGATSAQGKIVYTDIDPDAYLTSGGTESYNIDVGGEAKFTIHCTDIGSFYWLAKIEGKTTNAVWAVPLPPPNLANALALSSGTAVNDKTMWSNEYWYFNLALFASTQGVAYYEGRFGGESGKYIGIKFRDDGNTHYGWIQVDIPSDVSSVTVTGWAYNDTPDGAITTGMIPEPNALALLALGAAGISGLRRIFIP